YEVRINLAESIRLQEEIGIVAVGDPHENPGVAPRQTVRRMTGVLESFKTDLQEQTLLWIHAYRFPGGNPEEAGIELVHVFQESDILCVHISGCARVRVVIRTEIPPFGRCI